MGCILLFASQIAFAANAPLPNPLSTVREGQWVSYKVVLMGMEAEQRQSIVGVTGTGDDRILTMKVEILLDGQVVQSDEHKVTYQNAVAEQLRAFDDSPDTIVTATRVMVKDREVDGVRVDFVEDGLACKLFLSESVPVVGIVRMEIEGFDGPVMELLDFGE